MDIHQNESNYSLERETLMPKDRFEWKIVTSNTLEADSDYQAISPSVEWNHPRCFCHVPAIEDNLILETTIA